MPEAPGDPHPRLAALIARARAVVAAGEPPVLAIAHPCDAAAMHAAEAVRREGIARPLLVGVPERVARAAAAAEVDLSAFELAPVPAAAGDQVATDARSAAARAVMLTREGAAGIVMKGSLHTDELMSAVVRNHTGLRGERRISHAFVFDAPRYPKLIALADCVVNIAPDLHTKRDIVFNAVELLRRSLGIARPKVGLVAAVETVSPQMQATVDAAALVAESKAGAFGDAIVDGPFGFDNAISAEAAHVKGIVSAVPGDADLLVLPDLNAGNILYKSFVYIGGAECAGLVLGGRAPVVLTSRADSLLARVASVALATLSVRSQSH